MWLLLAFISTSQAEEPKIECAELSNRMDQILARVQSLEIPADSVLAPEKTADSPSTSKNAQPASGPNPPPPQTTTQDPPAPLPATDTSDDTVVSVDADSPA